MTHNPSAFWEKAEEWCFLLCEFIRLICFCCKRYKQANRVNVCDWFQGWVDFSRRARGSLQLQFQWLKVNSQRSRQAKPWDLMVSRLYCTNEELVILLDLWLTYSVSQSKSAAFGVDGNFLTFARSIKDTRRMSTTCYLFRFCICLSRSPPREWRRPRGRPHLTWAAQISAIRPIADIASLAQDRAAFKRWTATVTLCGQAPCCCCCLP